MDSAVVRHAGLLERRVEGRSGSGRAWGGTEVSGSRRQAAGCRRRRPRRLPAGATAARSRRPTSCRRAARAGSTRSTSCCFPRFNILCLPGVTSDDDAQVGERARLLPASSAASCRRQPGRRVRGDPAQPRLDPGARRARRDLLPARVQVPRPSRAGSRQLNLPACGAVAGVMARIDTTRGIWKAPAGPRGRDRRRQRARQPTGADVDDNLSGQLNPHGINVLRTLPGAPGRSSGAPGRSRATTRSRRSSSTSRSAG